MSIVISAAYMRSGIAVVIVIRPAPLALMLTRIVECACAVDAASYEQPS